MYNSMNTTVVIGAELVKKGYRVPEFLMYSLFLLPYTNIFYCRKKICCCWYRRNDFLKGLDILYCKNEKRDSRLRFQNQLSSSFYRTVSLREFASALDGSSSSFHKSPKDCWVEFIVFEKLVGKTNYIFVFVNVSNYKSRQ